MSNKILTGYVLATYPYRERDAMVDFLSDDYGVVRLVIAGYFKVNSKQTALGIEFTYVAFDIGDMLDANRLIRVRGGTVLKPHIDSRQDFRWLTYMSCAAELIRHYYHVESKKIYIDGFSQCINSENIETDLLGFVKEIIADAGLVPYIEGCVVCDSKGINGISINHGGLVCRRHCREQEQHSRLFLIDFIGLFKNRNYSVTKLLEKEILVFCIHYLEFHTDYRMSSLDLISEV